MGANQSYETDFNDVTPATPRTKRYLEAEHQQNKKKKAKPAAPHRPTVTAVTHDAVALTWHPPRHTLNAIIAYTVEVCRPRHSRQWLPLTKNCQGTHYHARHLQTDTEYIFRVRAENIFGTGKPSAPSTTVTTKIFEMSSDLSCYITPSASFSTIVSSPSSSSSSYSFSDQGFPKSFSSYEVGGAPDTPTKDDVFSDSNDDSGLAESPSTPGVIDPSLITLEGVPQSPSTPTTQSQFGSVKRRHSFSVRLEGRVSSILSNSDRFGSSRSINPNLTTSHIPNSNEPFNNSNINFINNNNYNDFVKSRRDGNCNYNGNRNSATNAPTTQHSFRKSTIPILLPGTGSNSLNRLRESRSSLKSNTDDTKGNRPNTLPRHRVSSNRNRKSQDFRSSVGSTASDSNTNTSSSGSFREENCNKTGQGSSRLSLQSTMSDVTMSNQSSHSSDDQSSRPVSFSDNGDAADFSPNTVGLDEKAETIQRVNELNTFGTQTKLIVDKDFDSYLNEDEEISKLKCNLKNMEITEEKLKFHDLKEKLKILSEDTDLNVLNVNQKDYYQSLDNPWERGDVDSVNHVSENIMAAPFTDDVKIAFNARHRQSNDVHRSNSNTIDSRSCGGHESNDFRTLRSVLQSNHVIVKQSRPMPEVVGVVLGDGGETTTLTRGKLTTIADVDEEEEAVRITTL